jgi:hypothetical protein
MAPALGVELHIHTTDLKLTLVVWALLASGLRLLIGMQCWSCDNSNRVFAYRIGSVQG